MPFFFLSFSSPLFLFDSAPDQRTRSSIRSIFLGVSSRTRVPLFVRPNPSFEGDKERERERERNRRKEKEEEEDEKKEMPRCSSSSIEEVRKRKDDFFSFYVDSSDKVAGVNAFGSTVFECVTTAVLLVLDDRLYTHFFHPCGPASRCYVLVVRLSLYTTRIPMLYPLV